MVRCDPIAAGCRTSDIVGRQPPLERYCQTTNIRKEIEQVLGRFKEASGLRLMAGDDHMVERHSDCTW